MPKYELTLMHIQWHVSNAIADDADDNFSLTYLDERGAWVNLEDEADVHQMLHGKSAQPRGSKSRRIYIHAIRYELTDEEDTK